MRNRHVCSKRQKLLNQLIIRVTYYFYLLRRCVTVTVCFSINFYHTNNRLVMPAQPNSNSTTNVYLAFFYRYIFYASIPKIIIFYFFMHLPYDYCRQYHKRKPYYYAFSLFPINQTTVWSGTTLWYTLHSLPKSNNVQC